LWGGEARGHPTTTSRGEGKRNKEEKSMGGGRKQLHTTQTGSDLKEQGLKGRIAVTKSLLRPANIQKYLKFKVLWMDESKFQLFSQHHRVSVHRKAGERFDAGCVVPTAKHDGDSIMVWGSICGNGTGELVKIYGVMNKKVYQNILVHDGIPSGLNLIGCGFIDQEDNDPKHTSKLCTDDWTKINESGILELMD
uniref:Uncharacterized protein n=1 Tax=Amphiprion percula TaxID=161767 RepID=A0A3P8U5F7_AMPPE